MWGGGGRQWIKKAVNVITLTLMAVDKDKGGGGPAVDKKNLNVITLTLMAVDKGGGGKTLIHQRWIKCTFFLKTSLRQYHKINTYSDCRASIFSKRK